MAVIRGKIEVSREVNPKRTTFGGKSPFTKSGGQWIVSSEPSKTATLMSFDEFFGLREKPKKVLKKA